MIVIGLFVLIGVLLMVIGNSKDSAGAFVSGALLVVVGVFLVVPMTCNRAGVGGELAQIESLRMNVEGVDLRGSEAIYGQAAEVNQLIASNQWFRRQWWGKDFVSAKWDSIRPIELNTVKEKRR